jgi:MFS family permease
MMDRLNTALRALRHRNFRLFFFGQSISVIGTWMTRLATAWLIYRLTGSAWLLGVTGFAGQIPTFLISPFAGVWVDRWNRHTVLVVTQAAAMVQSFALAALALSHTIHVWQILVLAIFQGVINAFDMPARQSFLVEMVEGRDDLASAIALNSSIVNLARLLGPSIAGIVIAIWGEGFCFLADGISYIAVIASLLMMHVGYATTQRTAKPSMIGELRAGWKYVSTMVSVRTILILFAIVSLMGIPYTTLMPIFATKVLGGGAHTLGFLMGAAGCGALAAAVWLAMRKTVLGLGRVIGFSCAVFGLALAGFSLSRIFWLSMVLLFIAGFGMVQQMSASNTIIQTLVADDMRGRVMSYYAMAFFGMAPFGSLMAGGLAHVLGAPHTLLLTGICCAAGSLWYFAHYRDVRESMRPIYRELGILPSTVEELQGSVATDREGVKVG